jgi:hypothetical protein
MMLVDVMRVDWAAAAAAAALYGRLKRIQSNGHHGGLVKVKS